MEQKAKVGRSALGLIGAIYTPLGGGFLALGMVLAALLPGEARLVGLIFAPIGGMFFLLGLTFLTVEYGKKKRIEALVEAGHFVWAEIVDCVRNDSVRVNHRSPYQLIARYTDGRGANHLFRSQNIYFSGPRELVGKTVRVYVDDHFKHYYMETESLLGRYIEH